jgi:hypothetical protein
MTCDPRLLSYYRDGALSLDDRYEFEGHLRECDECTSQLRGLMRLAQVVRSLPMETAPNTLKTDVYRLVAEREQERRQPIALGGIGRALAPAAVAAAIAVSTLVVFRPGALDLANRPVSDPVAASSEAAPSQPVVQAVPPAVQPSAQSARTATGAGALGSKPAFQPVAESNPGNLPIKMVNPATVPEPIARLYGQNEQIRAMLGEASPGSRTVTLLEQSFQGGLAIWRSDTREIYMLRRDGNTWSAHSDTWRPGERIAVDTAPPPGALVPAGGFGSVWKSTPEIKSRLGWAVYEPRGSGGSIQMFEHGMIVWTPHGLLYVLSNDGRWRTFPDATPL